jgi:hypothetical protein
MLPITVRKITSCDIDVPFIQGVVNEHWVKGRKSISKIPCRRWRWFQTNGATKDMVCPGNVFSSWNVWDIVSSRPEKQRAGTNGETKAPGFFPSMEAPVIVALLPEMPRQGHHVSGVWRCTAIRKSMILKGNKRR